MSISSSMYVGANGVIAQQDQMSVISDNIANIDTIGFKSSRLLFETLISEQLTGATSGNQIGLGVGISSVWQDMMTVGGLETTNSSTDLAIGGSYGYFMVSPEGSDNVFYTRAGSFTFDKDGYLRDTNGNILQGYELTTATSTSANVEYPEANATALGDIQISTSDAGMAISLPEATSEVIMMVNLDSDEEDNSTSETSPMTALFDQWDGTSEEPLGAKDYAYTSSLTVYDENGTSHVLTVYFDPVEGATDTSSGYRMWEYVIGISPEEDASTLLEKSGILMTGTMTFTPAGALSTMSAFTGTSDDKTTWIPAELSEDGLPIFNATFSDGGSLSSTWDIGLNGGTDWNMPNGVTTLADVTASATTIPKLTDTTLNAMSTTNYNSGTSTIFQDQNGYPEGDLQSVYVDSTGEIVGEYSNGQSLTLFRIPLADFINPQGLYREGGNLFSATTQSGAASIGWAGENRLSQISSSTLEQSNVDLATEFSNMIMTQRAFDANSKVITTSDQVVQTALGLKR